MHLTTGYSDVLYDLKGRRGKSNLWLYFCILFNVLIFNLV